MVVDCDTPVMATTLSHTHVYTWGCMSWPSAISERARDPCTGWTYAAPTIHAQWPPIAIGGCPSACEIVAPLSDEEG